jgi:hypothetical protein
MPNTIGAAGIKLNDEVLSLMRSGRSPEKAVEHVVAANPDIDAGMIALSLDGHAFAANTVCVQKRRDIGRAAIGLLEQGAQVIVLHNAIRPHRPIAALASEIAMDVMQPDDRPDGWITFRAGIPLVLGAMNAVGVNSDGVVEAVIVENHRLLAGPQSLGIGFEAPVLRHAEAIGVTLYEPYMVVADGRLQTVDGQSELSVPIRRC